MLRSKSAHFCTFTYKNLKTTNLVKSDFQNMVKRLRHKEKQLKYFACGEYGEKTNRPHWHAIMFNVDPRNVSNEWKEGFAKIVPANRATIHYLTGYVLKQGTYDLVGMVFLKKEEQERRYKPVMMCSKGLGSNYANDAGERHRSLETMKTKDGMHLSRYLISKIWKEHEEERLKITEKEKLEFLEKLKSSGKKLSAKAYYKLLHQHFTNKQKF